MNDQSNSRPRGQRRWRMARWLLATVVVSIMGLGAALYATIGKPVIAPEWMRAALVERINDNVPGLQVSVRQMALVLERDWVPRVAMRNVRVTDSEGGHLANLSEINASAATWPLLNGEVRPTTIRLSGARLRLRRTPEGPVRLVIGDAGELVNEAQSFAGLLSPLGEVLEQPQFSELRRVDAGNLTVQYDDLRAGQSWTVDGGRLELSRENDDLRLRGDFALLGARNYATTLEMYYEGQIGERAARFGLSFTDMPSQDISRQSPALTWLDALDAPISGSLRASVDEDGALGVLNATLQIDEGVLQPTQATEPVPFSKAGTYFTYDPAQQVMEVDEIFVDSNWGTIRAAGRTHLTGIDQGWPSELVSQFRISDLRANPDDLYDSPIELSGATMDVRLTMDPFTLTLGQLSLTDGEGNLTLNGNLTAEPKGWNLALDGQMDVLTPDRLLELWPERVKDKSRKWISENVRHADLTNIQLAVRSRPKSRPDFFLGFDFDNLETRFVKELPLITGASGHGSIHDGRFVVNAQSGHVNAAQGGRVDISGTSFIIPNIEIKRGPARVQLKTRSTITGALSLLDEEPFRFLEKAGLPVNLADGRARIEGQLDFLLKPDLQTEEVAYAIAGQLSSVRSETLVEGRVLTASRLGVEADNTHLAVSGEGRIGQVPADVVWRTGLGPEAQGTSRLTGTIELSERFADEFGIGLLPGSISGAGEGRISIAFEEGRPGRFTLESDLDGVGVRMPQLNWALSQGATGALEVEGQLGSPPRIDTVVLDTAGLNARGGVTLTPEGRLNRAVLSRLRVGNWLDAQVELIGRGPGTAPEVRVTGGRIDMRETTVGEPGTGGNAAGRGSPFRLALDQLRVSDGIALTDFRAELETAQGAMDGTFSGRVNDGASVSGRVVPMRGRSAFRIQSSDAGGVMGSAGIIRNARGGKMDLTLVPVNEPGSYDGQLTAENVRLIDAPALAALFNTLSVVGLLEQLGGEGIHFGEVEARFRLAPDRVTLTSASAIGASMGISMDGYYFTEEQRMEMQGVFSPFYMVNAIGNIFTRRGEGLIGVNYRLSGPAESPKVEVNLLSAFTPGMFRELFRRPPPTLDRDVQADDRAPEDQPTGLPQHTQ